MKALVTGSGGMLARALAEELSGHFETGLRTRQELDVTDPTQVDDVLRSEKPDWVVQTAAFTDVDGAESRADEAYRVNAAGTRNVAEACQRLGCRLLYFSTDYVFDGSRSRPRREWEPVAPINTYGESKAAGERFVETLCPAHLIVRTSWLFGPGGTNFVTKILQRAAATDELSVVDDQRGCPTYTHDLAAACRLLMARERRGLYHLTNSSECSWFDFAGRIVDLAGLKTAIRPVPSSALPTAAARPTFSVLDNCMWRLDGEAPLRQWDEALRDYFERPDGPLAP